MTPAELERRFGRPLVEVVGDLCGLPRGYAVLTPDEAFGLLRIKRTAGYELLQSGAIPAKKLGGKWLIPTASLLMWLLDSEPGEPQDLRGLP